MQDTLLDQQSNPNTVVGYFYFDFNDVDKQSSKKAVRSLLLQCTQGDHDGARALEQLYHQCGDGQQQPAEGTIRAVLRDIVARPKEKYLVQDALDECTDREDVLAFLETAAHKKHPNLRILTTSRRERDIDECLSAVADHNIDI